MEVPAQDAAGNRLVQIQVVHRHGARSPAYGRAFPSICGAPAYAPFRAFAPVLPPGVPLHPAAPAPFAPGAAACYAGQLTPLGAAQMFALGARLRARYAALLPPAFDPAAVRLRSTAVRRTVESAVATLSGMYPAAAAGPPRSVPVEVRPRDRENMLAVRRRCNRIFELQTAARAAFALPPALRDVDRDCLADADRKSASHRAIALRDIAVAVRENGLEPLAWEPVAEPAGSAQVLKLNVPEMWGLALGKFVDELLHEAASHNTNGWRCKIYSGHDTTILPMMACFEDRAHRGIPDFAADVVLETWVHPDTPDEPKVRLKYAGEDVLMAGCEQYGPLCPVAVVRAAVAKHIPDDWDRACGGSFDPPSPPATSKEESGAEGTTF